MQKSSDAVGYRDFHRDSGSNWRSPLRKWERTLCMLTPCS